MKKLYLKKKQNDPYLKSLVDFFKYISPKLLLSRKNKKHEVVLKKLNLPLKKVEETFKVVIKERNKLANQKGFASYIDFSLSLNKIPKQNFSEFKKNISNFNLKFNNNRCLICEMSSFPFKSQKDVLEMFFNKHKNIRPLKRKIKIVNGDNTFMMYKKETDIFEITLDSNLNFKHKSLALLHELSHVVSFVDILKNREDPLIKGKYKLEKEAAKIEMRMLKELSEKLYKAKIEDIKNVVYNVLFEIRIHRNPEQNFGKLYGSNLYLLNERIIMKPLSALPHAIVQYPFIVSK